MLKLVWSIRRLHDTVRSFKCTYTLVTPAETPYGHLIGIGFYLIVSSDINDGFWLAFLSEL